MFSVAQKRQIAAEIEKLLLSFNHPEMPVSRPRFKLHVDGVESWSWTDIEPNWIFDDTGSKPGVNPWNELVASNMTTQKSESCMGDRLLKAVNDIRRVHNVELSLKNDADKKVLKILEEFYSYNKEITPLCDKCQRNADNSCKVDVKCIYFIPME